MLQKVSGFALLMVVMFSTSALMLRLDPATTTALDSSWQVLFVRHVAQVGLVGQIMNLDGGDVQPVRFQGQPRFYADCSPDGNTFVFATKDSAYVVASGEVRQIEASSLLAVDLSAANDGAAIFNGVLNGNRGVYVSTRESRVRELSNLLPTAGQRSGVMYDLSPDGSRVAYHTPVEANLYAATTDGETLARLPGTAFSAAWSPDGTMVALAADWDGNFEIYVLDVAHLITAQLTRRTRGYGNTFPAWTPDGRQIMFVSSTATGLGSSYGGDLAIINLDGSDQRRLAHFQDEVVMGCLLTTRPASLVAES